PWDWDITFMLGHFGWKAVIAVVLNTFIASQILRKEFQTIAPVTQKRDQKPPPWILMLNLLFLVAVVMSSHHPAIFIPVFILFLGATHITEEYNEGLKLREGLFV